jgi:hypothetical protein
MSRDELAEACVRLGRRTDRGDIMRYEDGLYEPRLRTFATLDQALGVCMDVLCHGEVEAQRVAWQRERE